MLSDVVNQLDGHWPLVSTTLILLLGSLLWPRLFPKNVLAVFPLVGGNDGDTDEKRRKEYMTSAKALYNEGYQKFKDGVFRITTANAQQIVVSPKFLPELRNLPDNVLDIYSALEEAVESKYTGLRVDAPDVVHWVRSDLTANMGRLYPFMTREVAQSVYEELPPCEDWTEVHISKLLQRVVAKVSGYVFIGSEHCREEVYIDASINYTMDVETARLKVKDTAPWKRPFVVPFFQEIKNVQKRREQAYNFLRPIISARLEAQKKPEYVKPDDMLQRLMDSQVKAGTAKEIELMAEYQLGLSLAAILTTSTSMLNIFYNLTGHPEYVEPLREEIREVMAEHGGEMTPKALQGLKKLDSFIMETNRKQAVSYVTFQRKVKRGFTLSNGQYIPAGVEITVPGGSVNSDSEIFPDQDKFDGFRFYKMRMDKTREDANRHQAVGVTVKNLNWGYGRHACPGRFFAVNEMKLIVSHLLLNYDIKNAGDSPARYDNFMVGPMNIPDPSKNLMFKKI